MRRALLTDQLKRRVMLGSAACALSVVLGAGCKPSSPDKSAPSGPVASEYDAAPTTAAAATPAPVTKAPMKGIVAGAGVDPTASKADGKPPVLEFAVPRTVAVGKSDDVSFVIQGASIEPRNPESVRLVLLVRMNNRSAYGANLWDANFRLITHNAVIPANGGLNVLVDPRSDSMLERVQFVVPLTSVPRALKLEHGGESVELPLRFIP
jgi:hypothetical protein